MTHTTDPTDDIQKILGGQDLGVFIITGEVPTS